jgi:TM2 domain-containing membrane protein YozV/type II secretory pathway pseudopilin PulG
VDTPLEPQRYKIIFEGKVAEGVDPETARGNLQRLLKVDDATLEKLFSGKRVVLKKGCDASVVKKYQAALTKAGLQYKAEPETSSTPDITPTKAQAPEPAPRIPAAEPNTKAQPQDSDSSEGSPDPYAPPKQDTVIRKQVFCRSCGNQINESDTTCSKCGDKQIVGKPKSKVTAALLAIFLGFLGAHRFYLGQWIGLVYIFFGFIAWAIALVEAVVFLLTSKERWDQKYGNVVTSGGAGLVIVVVFVFIVVVGILAAIAIPTYQDYVHRANVAKVIVAVQPTHEKIEQFALREKYFPGSNLEAGLPGELSVDQVSSLIISGNGVLTVTLSSKKGSPLDGQTLVWIPRLQGASVQWDCSGGTLPAKFRSKQCRAGAFSNQQAPVASHWVTADDGLTRIRLPNNWKQMPELTEIGSIEYGNPRREQYALVISEPKADLSDSMDLEAYNELLLDQNYRSGINNLSLEFRGQVSFNDLKGLKYEVRGEIDNINIVYLHTSLEGKNHFHQVLFWTLPTRWADAAEIYEAALTTFSECDGDCRNP